MTYLVKKILIISFSFVPIFSLAQDSKDLFSQSNTHKYAEYLFDLRQFQAAMSEYAELLKIDSANSNFQRRFMESAIGSGKYEEVWAFNSDYYQEANQMPIEIARLTLKSYHFSKENQQFENTLNGLSQISDDERDFWMSFANIYWQKPKKANISVFERNDDALNVEMLNIYNEAIHIKIKSPILAAGMSAVVPGSGKFYTGEWQDAIMAFVFVGVSAFQSYRGFDSNGVSSFYGWAFGTIGLGYYLGNIYGSVKSARKTNDKRYINLRNRMDLLVW